MKAKSVLTFEAHNYAIELCEQLGIPINDVYHADKKHLNDDGFEVIYLFILAILTKGE